MLDSAKEAPAAPAGETSGEAAQPAPAAPAEPAPPPPADDKAAQETAQPAEIQAVTAEKGTRVEQPDASVERKRPEGTQIVKEIGDRIVIEFNNQIIVESSDRPRMSRGARDVYYEDLPRGRTRETVVRGDGTEVVTIRNAYGDIVRRSRITPDGREYVLVYVDDQYYDRLDDWRDPGLDLPPMQLDVPVSDYILDAGRVDDPEAYYEFLERPPVERVERLYSVDEVKRSARIRDKTPRIELDTVTFEFGSAAIAESEIPRLQGVADAMDEAAQEKPGRDLPDRGPYRRGRRGCRQSGAVRPPRRIGRRRAHQRLRHPAGEPGNAGLWRALPEDQDAGAGTAEPPRRDPPDHAAGRPGRERQLSGARLD